MNDLVELLRKTVDAAPKDDRVATIHIFGIDHAARLEGVNLKDLAGRAGIPESYHAEIRKGMRLSRYVEVVRRPA